jgi:hypothetical protein
VWRGRTVTQNSFESELATHTKATNNIINLGLGRSCVVPPPLLLLFYLRRPPLKEFPLSPLLQLLVAQPLPDYKGRFPTVAVMSSTYKQVRLLPSVGFCDGDDCLRPSSIPRFDDLILRLIVGCCCFPCAPQRLVVMSLHGMPRFGHPDNFSSLLSAESEERKEYTDGIIAFGVVLAVFAFLWAMALLVLKYTLKEKRVGCAAGGRVQDVTEMRNNKLTRSARKKRILRNWRTQLVFLACTMLIPTLSFLLVNHGLDAFFDSLDEVEELSGSAHDMALAGIGLATDITYSQNRVNSLLLTLQPEKACPNFDSNGTGLEAQAVFGSFNSTLQRGMNQINDFVDNRVSSIVLGLSKVSHLSNYVKASVQSTESYDWLVKGFLIALNTVNVFLFIGVCLTRCSLHHPLYQQFLTWLAVPAFCAVLCGSVLAVVVASALSIANADFCSGGVNATWAPHGSPLGTLLEIFERKGYNESNLPHQALRYYGQVRPGVFKLQQFGRLRAHFLSLSSLSLSLSLFALAGMHRRQPVRVHQRLQGPGGVANLRRR